MIELELNNTCSVSTRKRMCGVSGRNLRIRRTRSVGTRRMMLTLWLADKILDAVGDDELSKDAIAVAQKHLEAS